MAVVIEKSSAKSYNSSRIGPCCGKRIFDVKQVLNCSIVTMLAPDACLLALLCVAQRALMLDVSTAATRAMMPRESRRESEDVQGIEKGHAQAA